MPKLIEPFSYGFTFKLFSILYSKGFCNPCNLFMELVLTNALCIDSECPTQVTQYFWAWWMKLIQVSVDCLPAVIQEQINPTSKKPKGGTCSGEAWGQVPEHGLHIFLDSKTEERLGRGGERREELHVWKEQPKKVMLCGLATSNDTNFQLYCQVPLLFFTCRIFCLSLAKSWWLLADIINPFLSSLEVSLC